MKKRPFYLSKRKLPSGKSVYYFYYYDFHGNRTTPKSTGCSKKAEAMEYCIKLLHRTDLKNRRWLLTDFAQDMYKENSRYIEIRSVTSPLKRNTINTFLSAINNHITPYFKGLYLDEIDSNILLNFNLYLKSKNLSTNSCVSVMNALKSVFNFAFSEGIINSNPIKQFRMTKSVVNKREAFTYEEVIKVMTSPSWNECYDYWLYALTGVITGMRLSEIQGLKSEDVHDNYIDIKQQCIKNEIISVKNNEKRFVCIPVEFSKLLKSYSKDSYFVFYGKTQYEPMCKSNVTYKLKKIVSIYFPKEATSRVLTFHAFRYFLNTYLLINDVNEAKVNFIIGHKTGNSMQQLYTTWKVNYYSDVIELQSKLFSDIMSKCNWAK